MGKLYINKITGEKVVIVDNKAVGMGYSIIGKTFIIYNHLGEPDINRIFEHKEFYRKFKKAE